MFKNDRLNQLLLFAGVIALIFLSVFNRSEPPVIDIAPTKHIETRVEGKEKEILTIHEYIGTEEKVIAELSDKLDVLKTDLEIVKQQRDTFQIVQIQDTLIKSLTKENYHLNNVVKAQDSIIIAQRYIINSKDTIIAVGEHDLKKVKKQRNISILFNVIEAGIIILK